MPSFRVDFWRPITAISANADNLMANPNTLQVELGTTESPRQPIPSMPRGYLSCRGQGRNDGAWSRISAMLLPDRRRGDTLLWTISPSLLKRQA
jgi:hypothetical protein